jgi:DNA repair protein RadD
VRDRLPRLLGRVAEWQTRWLQVPVSFGTWGFKSPFAHKGVRFGDLVDREQLRARMLAQQAAEPTPEPQPIPVSPQGERRSARARVNERTRSVANRILSELELPHPGHQLMAVTGGRRQHNSAIVIRRQHATIDETIGMANNTRGEWSRGQLRTIFD